MLVLKIIIISEGLFYYDPWMIKLSTLIIFLLDKFSIKPRPTRRKT